VVWAGGAGWRRGASQPPYLSAFRCPQRRGVSRVYGVDFVVSAIEVEHTKGIDGDLARAGDQVTNARAPLLAWLLLSIP